MAFRAGPPATASDAATVNVNRTVARMVLLPGQQCMIVHPLRRGFIPNAPLCRPFAGVPVPGTFPFHPDQRRMRSRQATARRWHSSGPAMIQQYSRRHRRRLDGVTGYDLSLASGRLPQRNTRIGHT